MKLHIGSGSVFLLGYLNVDVRTPHTFLASERPDLVERWATKEDAYYARHEHNTIDSFRSGPLDQEYVCDKYGSFTQLPLAPFTVSEVLARQSFEHLSHTEARAALEQIENVLEPDGILRLDVPDHGETVRLLRETGDAFYERHLYGPRRDPFGYHVMSYTREALIALVTSCGFVYQFEEPNIHPYPAFTLRFIKSSLPPPHSYVKLPIGIPTGWTFADLGPGAYPHPYANLLIDCHNSILQPINTTARKVVSDLNTGLRGIKDKCIDYLWCSHVLEHVNSVTAAISTMQRVAHRGTIVVPSFYKEALFNFEEIAHKWLVVPHPVTALPIFIKRPAPYEAVKDIEVQRAMCRLFRTGPNRHEETQYLRNWYKAHEPQLDVVLHWEGEIKVQVIE